VDLDARMGLEPPEPNERRPADELPYRRLLDRELVETRDIRLGHGHPWSPAEQNRTEKEKGPGARCPRAFGVSYAE
jgi:hypothetical protein